MPDVVSDQPRLRRHRTFGSILGGALTALLPVLACFLGGGTLKWEEGIVVALLQAQCFFFPPWRTSLMNDFSTTLPATVSAQPWISGTCLVSLIAGASWL